MKDSFFNLWGVETADKKVLTVPNFLVSRGAAPQNRSPPFALLHRSN
jgi:hypothetical protein